MPGLPVTRPAPSLPPERRLALVIATARYADTTLRQLRSPARDAVELTAVLGDPQIGGFAVTSVIDQAVQQVRIAVEDFLASRSLDDLLLVYLSCHGLIDKRRRLYFATTDTDKTRLAATALESHWLLEQMDDCRARRQVVILDCCFSGAFASRAKGDTELDLRERFASQGRGRAVLTASRSSEYSFEGEPVLDSLMPQGSVFTTALLDGLRSGAADADKDGYVSVDEAYAYTYNRVREIRMNQTPQRWLYGAEGSILLARSPAGVTIVPKPLPSALRAGLDSPYPFVRGGAVQELSAWLADQDLGKQLAALQALQDVADTDIPQVASVARELLRVGSQRVGRLPSSHTGSPPLASADHRVTASDEERRNRAEPEAGKPQVVTADASAETARGKRSVDGAVGARLPKTRAPEPISAPAIGAPTPQQHHRPGLPYLHYDEHRRPPTSVPDTFQKYWRSVLRIGARVVLGSIVAVLGLFWGVACVVTVDQMLGRSTAEDGPLWAAFVGTTMLAGLLFLVIWVLLRMVWPSLLCLIGVGSCSLAIQAIVLTAQGYLAYGITGIFVWSNVSAGCIFLIVQGFRSGWKRHGAGTTTRS
jgi:hypothetical protein